MPGAGEKILIVEDEPMVRAIAAEILSRAGYAITTAENGEEALQLFEQGVGFDLIVSDLMMPKLTGFRAHPGAAHPRPPAPDRLHLRLPAGRRAERTPRRRPAVTFIGKPYSAETLTAAVRRQLDLER